MKKINKKENIISYLKLFAGILMVSPLVFAFFYLNFGILKSFVITLVLYIFAMLIGIPMFNYLEYGKIKYFIIK